MAPGTPRKPLARAPQPARYGELKRCSITSLSYVLRALLLALAALHGRDNSSCTPATAALCALLIAGTGVAHLTIGLACAASGGLAFLGWDRWGFDRASHCAKPVDCNELASKCARLGRRVSPVIKNLMRSPPRALGWALRLRRGALFVFGWRPKSSSGWQPPFGQFPYGALR
jgi:hypothetical protein